MFASLRLLFVTLLACASSLGSLKVAHAQFATPEAAIQALYDGKNPNNGPGFPSDEAGVRRFLEPGLAKAWLTSSIGADPFIEGQDWEISSLSISPSEIIGERAVVEVSFRNFNAPVRLVYHLRRDIDGWRVYDITSGGAHGLRGDLGLRE
jgi:hypothetical protein